MGGRLSHSTTSVRRRARLWTALLVGVGLTACGPSRVIVEGEFPPPLIEPLPVTLGIWYDEDFAGHELFDEARTKRESDWIVATGEAQIKMWDTLLEGMFDNLVHLEKAPGTGVTGPDVDGVLIPHVDELQYAIPSHTSVKIYEIWMRYRFELVTPDGKPIGEWTMTSYGKTPTAFLRSDEAAVNLAAVMALRDAGANFATTFTSVPAVRDWLRTTDAAPKPVEPGGEQL